MVSSVSFPRWFSQNGFFQRFSTLVLTKWFLPEALHVGSHKMVSSRGSPRWFSHNGFFQYRQRIFVQRNCFFLLFSKLKWFLPVVLHPGSHYMVSSGGFPRWFSLNSFFRWFSTLVLTKWFLPVVLYVGSH